MKKKELLSLPVLGPTPDMIRIARDDTGEEGARWGRKIKIYSHQKYLRAAVTDKILHIEIYDREKLIDEVKTIKPDAIIYISAAAKQYTTQVWRAGKAGWRQAMISNLTEVANDWKHEYKERIYIDPEEETLIREYLSGTMQHKGDQLINLIQKWQVIAKHKSEIAAIDRIMDQVTHTPADLYQWAKKEALYRSEYMLYSTKRKIRYCTACGQQAKIEKGEKYSHNQSAYCPACGRRVQAKSWNKQNYISDWTDVSLLQKIDDGWIVRFFSYHRKLERKKMDGEWGCVYKLHEHTREHYGEDLRRKSIFEYGGYKQTSVRRWRYALCPSAYMIATVYYKNIDTIRVGTGLQDLAIEKLAESQKGRKIMLRLLMEEANVARYLIDGGLYRLAAGEYGKRFGRLIKAGKSTPEETLGINRDRIARLKALEGGAALLEWLQYEQKSQLPIRQKTLARLDEEEYRLDDLRFALERGGKPEKIMNYVKKQPGSRDHVLQEWADYLRMAHAERLDTSDDIVLYPKDLHARHQALIDLRNAKEDKALERKYKQLNRKIKTILPSVRIYYWQDEDYIIIPAGQCQELIREGRTLHHCVGASDIYMKRMAEGESWICFLRKKENIDKSYYTLEIDMKTDTIRQWYSEYDRKPDAANIEKVLDKYKKAIKKRRKEDKREQGRQDNKADKEKGKKGVA